MTKGPAVRRYNRRVIVLMLAYAAILMIVVYGFSRHLLNGPPAYFAAILPALPIIGVFGAIGRYLVEETDEYVRMLTIRQTLYASGFALSIATIWGFLEAFDLVGHIESYYVAVLWFAGLGFGSCMNALTKPREA